MSLRSRGDVWWGKVNQPLSIERFNALKGRVQAYLQGQELFVQDLYAGADPAHRVRVRLVTTQAWNALFARNMFIRPPHEDLAGSSPTTSSCTLHCSKPIRRSTAFAPPPRSPCRSSRS